MKRLLNNQKYNEIDAQRIKFKVATIKATNQGKVLLNVLHATNPLDDIYPSLLEIAEMQYSQIKFMSTRYNILCIKTIKAIDESRVFGRVPKGFINDINHEQDTVFENTHKVMDDLRKFSYNEELLQV